MQHVVNEFWQRWRKEYLYSLQARSKWQRRFENLELNDVVLLKEEKPRNEWSIARVTKLFPNDDGIVRTVEIELANKVTYVRPVNKLILLQKYDSPTMGAK